MNETVNLRISRSGLSVRSSPTRNMAPMKGASPKAETSTNPGTGKETGGNTITCSMQDIWGFLTSLQNTIMKQSEEIKTLALQNQDLEHKLHIQDMRLIRQDEQIQELQEAFTKQTLTTQDALTTHDEKIAHICERPQKVSGTAVSWANMVRSGQPNQIATHMGDEMYAKEEDKENKEYNEQEKRKMNIVIRGIPESDTEKVLTLNTDITDLISTKFGMQDVVVYGAHRVGKKKPDTNRAIVCTLLDARKRTIILDNARIYLQGSTLYISEDRTPSQQQARREAYEARTKKKEPSAEEKAEEK